MANGIYQNRLHLINSLHSTGTLDGRYEKINCINCDITTGEQRQGSLSVVFKAYDKLMDKNVAIKFFDPVSSPFDQYRVQSFQREPEILRTIINKKRCNTLQCSKDCRCFVANC